MCRAVSQFIATIYNIASKFVLSNSIVRACFIFLSKIIHSTRALISWKPRREAEWFPTLISCSPNLPRVYIRLCKHGNHFTFLQLCTLMTSANKSFEKKIFHRVENVIKQLGHTSAVRSLRYEALGKFGEHSRS